MNSLYDKIPQDKAAEGAVLGSCILDSSVCDDVFEILNTESFMFPEHRLWYNGIRQTYYQHKKVDPVMLRSTMNAAGKIDEAGGVEYLATILDSVPSAANAVYYANRVKECQLRRDVMALSAEILSVIENPDIEEGIDSLQEKVMGLTSGVTESQKIGDGLADHYEELVKRSKGKAGLIKTGFRDLDELIGGFAPGEYIICAARPSVGKTALALSLAWQIGSVGIFSLEMTYGEIIDRLVSINTKIEIRDLRQGRIDEWDKVTEAMEAISASKLWIDDSDLSPYQIRSRARKMKKAGVKCIIIDYVNLLGFKGFRGGRVEELSKISHFIKNMAKELQLPVILLAQLNRGVEANKGKRPYASAIKGSGAFEQDADIVLLVHRDDRWKEEEGRTDLDGTAELIVAKARQASTGKVDLAFLKESAWFTDTEEIR